MRRVSILALTVSILLVACTSQHTAGSPSSPAASPSLLVCGPTSRLTQDAQSGLKIGPLYLRSFPKERKAVLRHVVPRGLTKMVVGHTQGTDVVSLTGVSCVSGRAVVFCYSSCVSGATAASSSPTPAGATPALQVDLSQKGDLIGYMVFPSAGYFAFSVGSGGSSIGTAVVHVRRGS